MNSSLYSSKEEIRNRIIKRAQELWGIEKVYDFDPLVVLMMEVLSSELFHITNDVNNLENRIFDKISRILAADNLVAPLPAHAIIQVQPSEDRILVKPNLHFFVKKKLGSVQGAAAEKAIEIDFSALHTAPLFNGRIRYMATSQSLYEMLPAQKKLIAKGTLPAEVHTIYLGIAYQGEDRRRAYQGLNFYFDWGNYQVSRETYTLLALSKWSLNEKPIKAFRDRFMEDSFHRVENDVFHRKHFLNILKQDVEAFYNDRFLTLEDSLDAEDLFSLAPSLPEFVSRRYDAALFNQDEQNLDWVRIDVPASIDYKLLDELYIHLNAIPVVNKRAVTSRNRLNVTRNIVPIKTEDMEQLLTVEQMMDKDGMLYSEIPYTSNLPSTAAGYYTIRHGSVERLDPRSAKDMVDYLFELIRDEKAAFSHYNADFLNRILVDLDKSLALIQQKSKLSNAHIKELQNYIVVNPKNENDLMFMTVWLTYGELANGTPVGSLLQSRSNNHITTEPIHFLSSSTGGRSRLGRVDSVQAFKYGITSSDKIVTKNDILNFVKYNLGSKVKRVTMGSGVQMDSSSTRGFYKTLDLMIEPHPQHGLASNEWEELLDQTLIKLIARSTIQVKYRIKLQVGSVT